MSQGDGKRYPSLRITSHYGNVNQFTEPAGAACKLLCRHCRTGFFDALFLTVGITVWQLPGHRFKQMCGDPETKAAGVADVDVHDVATIGLKFTGPSCQWFADFVADFR